MEQQQPNNDLLIKYLLHEVSVEEDAFVTEWLLSDSSNMQNFQALERIWLLTQFTDSNDTINLDAEWAIFKKNIKVNDSEPVPISRPEVHTLHSQPIVSRWKITHRTVVAMAVAASIIAIVFLGNFLFSNKPSKTSITAVTNKPKDTIALVLHHEVNNTGKPQKILLQDGSVVLLEDKSEISFTEPFSSNYRSVTLQGKANFSVAKDKTRPFTVYSDAIATTVLGTVFDISAYPQASNISVRLYEGKVVVNSSPTSIKKLQKAIYLSPGYEMVYDKQGVVGHVRPFSVAKPVTQNKPISASTIDKLNIPSKKGSWFMFNNQPLSHVFNQLHEMFKVDIQYSEKDVQKLYFIGQFNREDSIETILEQIAKSNNLLVTKSNNNFIIYK